GVRVVGARLRRAGPGAAAGAGAALVRAAAAAERRARARRAIGRLAAATVALSAAGAGREIGALLRRARFGRRSAVETLTVVAAAGVRVRRIATAELGVRARRTVRG